MFWGKKSKEDLKPTGTAAVQPAPVAAASAQANTYRLPYFDANRPMTVQDLPEMLLAHANVSAAQLQRAFHIQRETGEFLGEILVSEGILDENSLVAFLARHCKIPHLSLLHYLIDEALLGIIPPEFCLQHRLLPIDKMGRNLTVAMVNPLDTATLKILNEQHPELRIRPILCTSKHFRAVADRLLTAKSSKGQELHGKGQGQKAAAVTGEDLATEAVLDTVDLGVPAEQVLPAESSIVAEAELPPAAAFAEIRAVDDEQPLTDMDPKDALLKNVFGIKSDGIPDESGDGNASETSTIPQRVARKVTTVMIKSMRSTYGVLARRVSLFHGLDPESVAKLFARGKTLEFQTGQIIFNKGELGRCMYVILSGKVDIVDGERLLAHLDHGEIFGEMALLSHAARSASARAVAPTSLLVFNFADITHDLDKRTTIQLLLNISVVLSSRLRRVQSL